MAYNLRRWPWGSAWMPPQRSSWMACRTGGPLEWWGIPKTEVGDSMDLLLPRLAALGFCQPDGTFVATLADLGDRLTEMTQTGKAVCVGAALERRRSRAEDHVGH